MEDYIEVDTESNLYCYNATSLIYGTNFILYTDEAQTEVFDNETQIAVSDYDD